MKCVASESVHGSFNLVGHVMFDRLAGTVCSGAHQFLSRLTNTNTELEVIASRYHTKPVRSGCAAAS
jgi:hypothetical protein